MKIKLDPHAIVRAEERGAAVEEIYDTVNSGEVFPAKQGREGFRKNFIYQNTWLGKYYENKQLEVFAVNKDNEWIVITVIVKYF